MAVAELFIRAFITVLFEKLASSDVIRLARSAGVYTELRKWTDTLTQIQAVLVHAGQKHIEQQSIQLWLNKLQHLAYEIDDVLDDLATEAMRHQLKDASTSNNTSKELKFIPKKFHALKYGRKMSSKLDEITTKLRALKERFLLVLDDVWNEKYSDWELLQRPFTEGAPGSKVLVTTRKTMVASVMDSVQTYPLKPLSDEEALSLFAQHALGKQNFDVNQTLKLHGEDIVKKCDRLPLALRTLGRVFRTKSSYEEWDELLNSEIWKLDKENEIHLALRLSYYDLPPHLKQIFAYCCLFPKDYIFNKDELILLWMAEGLLDKPNGDKPLETLGGEYFEELVLRSFFQHSTKFNSQYTMHDLISDLATSVATEFFILFDDKIDADNGHEALEKVHHLSFIREPFGAYEKFKALQRARRVRTFLAMSVRQLDRRDGFYISNKVLKELLPQLQFLRVLSLAYYKITEVPQSIGSLKHMRYLNFSRTNITCLPEQVGDLHNLQSLLLSGCTELSSLPNSIVKLINLRHLDITDTPNLKKMPSGLGGLTGLQTLSRVIIGGSDECRLSDQKDLVHLCGLLSIEGLHNVKESFHAKEANLQQKKGLCDLQMKWSDVFDDSHNGKTEYEVIEWLRPFEKLTSLEIAYYMGTKFPSWVGDCSFVWLKELTLRGCRSCTSLPTLGHLPSLQKLFVERMDGIKSLGSELHRPSNSWHDVSFRSLEVLEFKDMKSWEEWSTSGGDKAGLFPCLREMSITDCPKLNVVAMKLIPSLQVLCVDGCSLAVLKTMVGVSSSISRMTVKNIKGLTQLHGDVLEYFKPVEYLNISFCDELIYLWESEAAAYAILVNLKRLELHACKNLVSLGEKEVNLVISVESFREVKIERCLKLKSYKCPNSIEMLTIKDCASFTSLTFPTMDDHPSTLKSLDIENCDHVEISNWPLMPSLESLSICSVSNLRLFPEGCLVHLTTLVIRHCDKIESIPNNGYGFLPFLCLRQLQIFDCKNLKSFPHEQLQSLTSLKEMVISKCPSLDESFPCGLWPPNLTYLRIGDLKKPVSEWGLQNFPTSLDRLHLHGGENDSGVVSFANLTFLLPSSLTSLSIIDFKELESLSDGLQHLTCLQHLHIQGCQKLRDLPETLLPSLSSLRLSMLSNCTRELSKKCRRSGKGKYWPIISQIPQLDLRSQKESTGPSSRLQKLLLGKLKYILHYRH